MTLVPLLLTNLAVAAACFVGLWLISLRTRDPSFVDAWWPVGMVVIAWTAFIAAGAPGPHRILITALTTVWGLRLGGYLFWRWRRQGADKRYVEMLEDARTRRGWGFATASLLLVFALQAPLQFLVCLPAQLGQVGAERPLGPLAIVGAALAVVGIVFETVGDWQLVRFKADPANKGKVLQTGLWRYTRHPNYFGDACVWWGLYLIAAEMPLGAWSLPGVLLITFLLTRGSGVPTVEGRMKAERPEYAAYVARTSTFIPLPPKKL